MLKKVCKSNYVLVGAFSQLRAVEQNNYDIINSELFVVQHGLLTSLMEEQSAVFAAVLEEI